MKRDTRLYLDDMLTYAREAHDFVRGMTTDPFIRDTRTQYAVAYALHIVGEAARNVPAETPQQHAQIPWQKIIGMRNRLAHDYLGTRPDIVLATAQDFASELIIALPPIIAEMGEPEDEPAS